MCRRNAGAAVASSRSWPNRLFAKDDEIRVRFNDIAWQWPRDSPVEVFVTDAADLHSVEAEPYWYWKRECDDCNLGFLGAVCRNNRCSSRLSLALNSYLRRRMSRLGSISANANCCILPVVLVAASVLGRHCRTFGLIKSPRLGGPISDIDVLSHNTLPA
jgi:hypothetical protein